MIKLHSKSPTEIHFVCNNQDEIDFCETNKDSIFNDFIYRQTNGRFKTLEEYVIWFCEYPEFGEAGIRAKWIQTKEWGLEWNIITDKILQDMFNDAYNKSKEKNLYESSIESY